MKGIIAPRGDPQAIEDIQSDISALKTRASTQESDTSSLKTRVSTLETTSVIKELRVVSKLYTLPANSGSVTINADNIPSGFKFLTWIGVSTVGYVGAPYIEAQASANASVFTSVTSGEARQVRVTYLCYR